MGKEAEEICIQRFLNWYNEQQRRNYTYERAEKRFCDLKGGLRWEFVAYEPDNPEKWIGIEVKELGAREVTVRFEFWRDLCRELTQDLARRKIEGEFDIRPPVLDLKPKERTGFLETFMKVLSQKAPNMKVNEEIDIGPDIAERFAHWPRERSDVDEWERWGRCRPYKLQITKTADSGYEVTSPISPIVLRDGEKIHKQTFGEADIKHANEQLRLAKEMGARETILLFACMPFVNEAPIKNEVQNLESHLSDVDHIYLVGMSKDIVVKIYPN